MKTSLSLKKHVTVLDETVILLNSLISEIQFSKSGINRILSQFSLEPSMKNLGFLSYYYEADIYADFHDLWRKSISSCSYYRSGEKKKMLQLGAYLGTTDVNSQMNMINLYLKYFSEYRNKARDEYERCGKIYSLLGLFTGAAVYILLI